MSERVTIGDDRIRSLMEACAGPAEPLPTPRRGRRAISRRAVLLALVVLVAIPLGLAQASGRFDGPRAVDPVPPPGTQPFGPASLAAARLTRSDFDCMVANGATVRREDRDTVVLDGDSAAARAACSAQHAAALAAQDTQAAREERAARVPLIQAWDRCTTAGLTRRPDGTLDATPAQIAARRDSCETAVLRAHGQEDAAAALERILTP